MRGTEGEGPLAIPIIAHGKGARTVGWATVVPCRQEGGGTA